MPERIPILVEWCQKNGIWIHPGLELREDGLKSISVYSAISIDPFTSVVKIPRSSILSRRSSALSEDIMQSLMGLREEPGITLAIALLYETTLGARSRWWGYIQSLPLKVNIPPFWDGDDGKEATKWFQGTEMERIMGMQDIMNRLRQYFDSTIQPLLSTVGMTVAFYDLAHAYSLVSSRAFHIDAYHGLSMVPIADAFNHVEDHHVHLETDYHVCHICGSLKECIHDKEIGGSTQQPSTNHFPNDPEDDLCEMVTDITIQPYEEVFNTYDSGLSNAQLLCHYGFLLEGNSNDAVIWKDIGEIDLILFPSLSWDAHQRSGRDSIFQCVRRRPESYISCHLIAPPSDQSISTSSNKLTGSASTHDGSQSLKMYPLIDQTSLHSWEGSTDESTVSPLQNRFSINADGAISSDLFAFLFSCIADRYDNSSKMADNIEPVQTLFSDGSDSHIQALWNEVQDILGPEANLGTSIEDRTSRGSLVLQGIAQLIEALCIERLFRMYFPTRPRDHWTRSSLDLIKILDSTCQSKALTRLALQYVIGEVSIIESCWNMWKEFARELE